MFYFLAVKERKKRYRNLIKNSYTAYIHCFELYRIDALAVSIRPR